MHIYDLERLHALENQIAATAEAQRAPLMAALEQLVAQAQSKGTALQVDDQAFDDDLFDNMPI